VYSLLINDQRISYQQVVEIAHLRLATQLDACDAFRRRIDMGADYIDEVLKRDGVIYGVTTGYGDSCTVAVPPSLVKELPKSLVRFHGCGMGRLLTLEESRAVIAVRLVSLCKGYSGVSFELLEHMHRLLEHNVIPVIPAEGSVGASGDLTPLSYLGAVIMGEREVYYEASVHRTEEVFEQLHFTAHTLRPKEGLAIMNGTAVMTGLACLALSRAEYLTRLAARISALAVIGKLGNSAHFDEFLFAQKPHDGQNTIAAWMRQDLAQVAISENRKRLQDRYSLRCAPHVIGVLADSLGWMGEFVDNEINSVNDNPLIDPQGGRILHGGHFYGGHIGFAMDGLKNAVANIADLLDRQMALLVDNKFNHGLPANLSMADAETLPINHGLKAVQIAASAWTAEALKLTMPASVFSRSTECHNQDKVSMGTISARDALRVLRLTEQVVAAQLLAACQAVEIRLRRGELDPMELTPALRVFHSDVLELVPPIEQDRALDAELVTLVQAIQSRRWNLYPAS